MLENLSNAGAHLEGKYGVDIAEITAGSTTYDNAPYTTEEIDRDGYGSAQVEISYGAALASGETLSLKLDIQDCATSGGSYSSVTNLLAATVVETASGGAASPKSVKTVNVDLSEYERYVKFVVTPDLSASGTDTVKPTAVCVLGGKFRP